MRRFASGIVIIMSVWLPRAVVMTTPVATTACKCGELGSPVMFDEATVNRNPRIVVSGPACTAKSVQCMHRDAQDRCDAFWIVPEREGLCLFSAQFDDNTNIEDAIQYELDTKYPCRGNIRTADEGHVTRIFSAKK